MIKSLTKNGVFLLLGVLLIAGACSKNTSDSGTQPTAPAAASEVIKVGEFASLTGKEAAFGQSSHKGTLLAIDEANAAGGVLGRKLKLVFEDNQSKQGESTTI